MSFLRCSLVSQTLKNANHTPRSVDVGLLAGGRQVSSAVGDSKLSASASTVTSGNGTVAMDESSGRKSLGFGFSAGGLVFPYLVGSAETLANAGLLTSETPCAGASAGSLVAALVHSGMTTKQMLDGALELCANCRKDGTRGRLKYVLEGVLKELMPEDAHLKCSGKAFVAVTQVYPFKNAGGYMVSEFSSKEDVIESLLTSCHIPWWFNNWPTTKYRNTIATDGGLVDFIPGPPGADRTVRVCCFPDVGTQFGADIAPGIFQPSKYSVSELLGWAFEPADEDRLLELYEIGKQDTQEFVSRSSELIPIQPEIKVETSSSGAWSRLRSVFVRSNIQR